MSKQGRSGSLSVAEQVTPQMARKWLDKNSRNRAVSESKVRSYHRDMTNGSWTLSGEPIALSRSGVLLNGQHRLLALIRYGQAVWMPVQYDCADDAVFDQGRVRTLGDILNIGGQRNGNTVAAWANVHAALLANISVKQVTQAEAAVWLSHHAEDVAFGLELMAPLKAAGIAVAPVAGAWVFAHPADPKRIRELAWQFASGNDLSAGSPLLVCRNYVLARTRGGAALRLRIVAENRTVMAKKVLRSIQLALRGGSMDKLQSTDQGLMHFLKYHGTACVLADDTPPTTTLVTNFAQPLPR